MDQTLHQAETVIVGSDGFIGRNLQILLSDLSMPFVKGIRSPEGNSDGFQMYRGKESFFEHPEIRRVIHVGTPNIESISDLDSAMNLHVEEVLEFAELCQKQKKKTYFYWAGSYWQDQDRVDYYTRAKRRIEAGLHEISSENFRVISLHLGDSYGSNDTRKKLIPLILESLNDRKILKIENNRNLMTPIHISDITNAFAVLFNLEKKQSLSKFQVFDLIGTEVVSVQHILNLVSRLRIEFQYESCEQNRDFFAFAQAHEGIPGWCPRISLAEGLRELISGTEVPKF